MVFASHRERTSPATRPPRPLAPLLLLLLSLAFLHAPGPSAAAQTARRPAPRLFGETQIYEWDKLESFARYLKRRPRERGCVVVYAARVRGYSSPDGAARVGIMREKLFENLGVEPGRVSLIDGGLREQATVELWVLPRGAAPPEPKPTAPREAFTICPQVSAGGETYSPSRDRPLTFAVSVRDGDPAVRPTFRWTVSRGRILGGQGEERITVGELGEDVIEVEASVEVLGLPAECENRATATTGVAVVPFKWDEYGNVRIGDEKARLDNFQYTLQQEPGLVAYVVVYGARRGRRNEAQNRADRAVNYLVNMRGLEPERVRAIDGGLRESLAVELWVSTPGGPAPVPTPTFAAKPAPRSRRK